jgi:hypothetical protein
VRETERQRACKQAGHEEWRTLPSERGYKQLAEYGYSSDGNVSSLGKKLRSVHSFDFADQEVVAGNLIEVLQTCPEMRPMTIMDWSTVSDTKKKQYEQLLNGMLKKQPEDIGLLAFAGEELTSFWHYGSSEEDRVRFKQGFGYLERATAMSPQDDRLAQQYCQTFDQARTLKLLSKEETIARAQDLVSRELPLTRACAAKAGLEAALQVEDWPAVARFVEPLVESPEADDQLFATAAKGLLALQK